MPASLSSIAAAPNKLYATSAPAFRELQLASALQQTSRQAESTEMKTRPAVLFPIDSPGPVFRETPSVEGLIGLSPALLDMRSRIRRVAPHYRTALITGKTGTGKELAARKLHRLSPASSGRFVAVNCSAIVETLFESELFGHVRGSFTGATQDKPGMFEAADRGTLFLDEIGDMPMGAQAKLLRTLQNQEVTRVGSLTPRKVDLRPDRGWAPRVLGFG
jgi:transcriptional regulator with GAF, ATPase, and Fis domain